MRDFGRCEETVCDRLITLREKRGRLVLVNNARAAVRKVTVDGCVIADGPRCDYLLIPQSLTEHYVELKGSDVRHAVEQIEKTIPQVSADRTKTPKKAIIVSTRCPMASPEIQQYQRRLKKQYNAQLLVRSSGCEVEI